MTSGRTSLSAFSKSEMVSGLEFTFLAFFYYERDCTDFVDKQGNLV
jgi:hypothetical protein